MHVFPKRYRPPTSFCGYIKNSTLEYLPLPPPPFNMPCVEFYIAKFYFSLSLQRLLIAAIAIATTPTPAETRAIFLTNAFLSSRLL